MMIDYFSYSCLARLGATSNTYCTNVGAEFRNCQHNVGYYIFLIHRGRWKYNSVFQLLKNSVTLMWVYSRHRGHAQLWYLTKRTENSEKGNIFVQQSSKMVGFLVAFKGKERGYCTPHRSRICHAPRINDEARIYSPLD